MKKTIILFSMFIIGFFMFHPEITNATSNFSEIKTPQELHQKLKDEKLISLDENGLIIILDSLSSLGVNQDLAEDYTKKLNIINQQIQDGIISMDKKLNVKPFTIEEIAKKVYQNDKKNKEQNLISPMADTCIFLINLVESNRDELEEIYETAQLLYNPSDAYNFTVGWWVGKVMPEGDWDYKVQPGYSPWYKEFCMLHYDGVVRDHNSKWLGNYNYGYTGELLFSLQTLYNGGDAISYLLNGIPDGSEAKEAIEWGYNDASTYY